jgi:hypothetical protein
MKEPKGERVEDRIDQLYALAVHKDWLRARNYKVWAVDGVRRLREKLERADALAAEVQELREENERLKREVAFLRVDVEQKDGEA